MHTKEPWIVASGSGTMIITQDRVPCIAQTANENAIADASRIVVCVNACAGTDNDALNKIARMSGQINFFNRIAIAEQQRDELLAALKHIKEVGDTASCVIAKAALAKCEA